mgnify:CR=1 FL=1
MRESNLHQKKRNLEMMISLIRDLGEIGSVLEKADGGLVMSCGVRHLKECPAVGVFGHTLSIEVYEIYPTLLFWNVDNVNILKSFQLAKIPVAA